MAVVASFTAVPSTGLTVPSDSVTFTDTSTGSPDRWLWDFDDGTYSTLQNPVHTYTGSIGTTFNPTLKAWIFDTSSVLSDSTITDDRKQTSGGDTANPNAAAFAFWDAKAWSTNTFGTVMFTQQYVSFIPAYTYTGNKITKRTTLSTPASGTSVFIVEARRTNISTTYDEGNLTSNLGGNLAASSDYTTWETFLDVSSYVGTVLDVDYHPVYEILLLEASVSSTGIQAEFRITEYNAADVGTATTAIVFGGTPPTAEFTATPKTGANPLSVQFTFTGDEAVGLPTTYSWKRRKTDSGDAFVEFSTSQNPLTSFTKA